MVGFANILYIVVCFFRKYSSREWKLHTECQQQTTETTDHWRRSQYELKENLKVQLWAKNKTFKNPFCGWVYQIAVKSLIGKTAAKRKEYVSIYELILRHF